MICYKDCQAEIGCQLLQVCGKLYHEHVSLIGLLGP